MTSRHFGCRLQPRRPVRDILLSNFAELSKTKKKMKILISWDLTANEIIPYLHHGKFGKFIDSFLDSSGTLQLSEPSNEKSDWGSCLS